MDRYIISYERNNREVRLVRRANSAHEALEIFAQQYGFLLNMNQVDADTRGHVWAEAHIYTNDEYGYKVWLFTALAEREEVT